MYRNVKPISMNRAFRRLPDPISKFLAYKFSESCANVPARLPCYIQNGPTTHRICHV